MKVESRTRWPVSLALAMLVFAGAFWTASPVSRVTGERATALAASDEVYVPAGQFIMGCSSDTAGTMACALDAQPMHAVYVNAYYIDKTEASNAQYAACVSAGACPLPLSNSSATRTDYYNNPVYANYPVLQMDWQRAETYCNWVGKRLPTEAEWEKAARGTDLRPFPWGFESPTCNHMNFTTMYYDDQGIPRLSACVGDNTPVNSYADYPSPYGALNMTGNAQEWVRDLYVRFYYNSSPYYNPTGPTTTVSGEHLIRGGPWVGTVTHANNWVRHDEADIYHTEYNGFRCARTATGPAPIPTPIPVTPTPHFARDVGSAGDMLWLANDQQLTLITVPELAVGATARITLSHSSLANAQGNLQGIDHYFRVTADHARGDGSLPAPLKLTLAFDPPYGGVISTTLALYRLTVSGWTTDGLTTTLHLDAGYLTADLGWTGTYAMLGATRRVYLPLVVRRSAG